MKKDEEVKLLLRIRKSGISQEVAAARAGMSVRTVRKYEKKGQLPSQLRQPRTYRTRPDPFAQDWPWVESELRRDAGLQAKTLFEALCQDHPGRYQGGQLRSLQRRVEAWRALHGPDGEVMFEQLHEPGRMAQSDFTNMTDLAITIGGEPFPHLLFHLVLTYSNHEVVSICFSESFDALAEGIERAFWQLGGVPTYHQSDNLSAAVCAHSQEFTTRYQALMGHYGVLPTHSQPGKPNENGDVEQSHHRFKLAVDQALRLTGSRDFPTRRAYEIFLNNLLQRRNRTRQERFELEREALKGLPAQPLDPCQTLQVKVTCFSTVRLLHNVYSVPSRLIGCQLRVRVRAEYLILMYHGQTVLTVPRLRGKGQHRIDYRHLIGSLVRKPGAFAHYRYREEFFPTLLFRRTYDVLVAWHHQRGDAQYLRILQQAATHTESEVEVALELLFEAGQPFGWEDVRSLVGLPKAHIIPLLAVPMLNLHQYDRLLPSRRCHHD